MVELLITILVCAIPLIVIIENTITKKDNGRLTDKDIPWLRKEDDG